MLSAIKLVGACAIFLTAVFGVVAIVLMLLSRIKILVKAFRECGFTLAAAQDGLRAVLADVKARPGSFLLGLTMFGAFVLFAEYVLLGLVALGVLGTLFLVIVRSRAPEADESLARHVGRPLFMDTGRQVIRNSAKASG
jgi:hypothetical protein